MKRASKINDDQDNDEFFDVNEGDIDLNSLADRGHLEKCGHWLLSIPRDDVHALQGTTEYKDFVKAFEKLGQAHRRVFAITEPDLKKLVTIGFSFLQHTVVDDVLLRVLEFLECHSLVRVSETCSRFRELAHRSATQRTYDISISRQLVGVMKLLRAKEEIDGSSADENTYGEMKKCHVSVPILGLEKRIIVTDAGDREYNGIYYCTGCDGNGFLFTKPRNQTSRATTTNAISTTPLQAIDDIGLLEQLMQNHDDALNQHIGPGPGNLDEPTKPGKLLRCIIARRFSNTVSVFKPEAYSSGLDNCVR
jgi:hypothetical protein